LDQQKRADVACTRVRWMREQGRCASGSGL
jgi:hypothetical protein